MRASNGIATIRKGNVFVIAGKYGVSALMSIGADGLRKNGHFALIFDGQCNSVALVGKKTIFHMDLEG